VTISCRPLLLGSRPVRADSTEVRDHRFPEWRSDGLSWVPEPRTASFSAAFVLRTSHVRGVVTRTERALLDVPGAVRSAISSMRSAT
jgi:hypothetical protein